ncbi:MAG TPA: class I SAM-dependent methyltransferase [Nannocystis exedens]|nr:class I SAM-dependent methyltransferase [Nannocystis exedens]
MPSSSQPVRGPAELYARLHRGNPGDIDFYRRACAEETSILELGCGHGRVLRAISSPQSHLVGVDLDRDLLALATRACQRIRPAPASFKLLQADMCTLDLGRLFGRILLPFCGIYCLADEAAILRTLRRARDHLTAKGELLFDAYHIDPVHDELLQEQAPIDDPASEVATLRWRSRDYHVFERSRWWPQKQVVEVTYEHRPVDGSPPLLTGVRHRYLLARELPTLLATAGLRILELAGGFHSETFGVESEMLVVRAARA